MTPADTDFNDRINDAIMLADRIANGGTLAQPEADRLVRTVGEMAARVRSVWVRPTDLRPEPLTPAEVFAAHNPGARVIRTG